MRSSFTSFAFALAAGCAVDEDPDPALSTTTADLTSPSVIVSRGECSYVEVDETTFRTFRLLWLPAVLANARVIASSPAYQQCLSWASRSETTITHGQHAENPSGTTETFGPYLPYTGDSGTDFGDRSIAHMPIERIQDLYATRIATDARSPNPLDIRCFRGVGGAAVYSTQDDRTAAETMVLSPWYFNLPLDQFFGPILAEIIWHEAIHNRDYHHPADPDKTSNQRAPLIAGACMSDLYARSEQICHFDACPNGRMMLSWYNPEISECSCVREPGAPPVLKGSWTFTNTISSIAVDGAGKGYVLANTSKASKSAYELVNNAWVEIGPADAIVANADMVGWRDRAPDPSGARRWTLRSRVGPQEVVLLGGNNVPAVDAFGALAHVSTTNNTFNYHFPYGELWHGSGGGERVFAGGDRMFKTDAANVWLLDPVAGWRPLSGDAAQFTVDSYGTLYSLSTAGQWLRRSKGSSWENIGDPGVFATIAAGDDLFARKFDGSTYRFAPGGTWQLVATCDTIAAGGRSLYCQRGGATIEKYDY